MSLSGFFLRLVLLAVGCCLPAFASPQSVRDFDARAREGGEFNVVFFGGSLTWGANASDPQTTSYRGLMMGYLLAKYPKASLRFHDAAIGGTGSDLGLFRLERDVLAKKPDLVFLDFTVNDDAEDEDPQRLAAYERLLRELLASGSAVMPVLMCFKHHTDHLDAPLPPRHVEHLKLATAYACTPANVLSEVRQAVRSGAQDPSVMWPFDGAHPDDAGYAVFFDIVRSSYETAITEKSPARFPDEPIFPALYPKVVRQKLSITKLPEGWKVGNTRRTSLWFDGLSSRWLDSIVVARLGNGLIPRPLECQFRGSLVGLFGERDAVSAPFRVWIDDQPVAVPDRNARDPFLWKIDTTAMGATKSGSGNLFAWTLLSKDLRDGEHRLRIEPVFDGANPEAELRIESVCSTGR